MLRDFKEAFRSVVGNPGVAFVVISTLALAIGANTALFSVLNGVLLRRGVRRISAGPFPRINSGSKGCRQGRRLR